MTAPGHPPSPLAGGTPPKATRREWIGLAVLALPCLLYSMDLTVLNLAVPQLSAALNPSAAELLWIVDIYGFLIAGSLIVMGTLGDRIGRRRLLLIGAAAFGTASVGAALSTSAPMLIAARALMGVAGAALAPSTLSLIRNMFLDPHQRTLAIGVWVASFSVGGAMGPVIGGVLLEFFPWGSVFLINVPLMALLLVLAPILLPEYRNPLAGRLDIASAALSLVAVLAAIWGLKRLAEGGAGWLSGAAILAGFGLALLFVRRQRRLADPLVHLALFRRPAFVAALLTNVLACVVAFAIFLFAAQYLQLVLGLRPLAAGLWSMPSGLAFVAGAVLAPRLLVRWRPADVVAGGLAFATLGFAALAAIGDGGRLVGVVGGLFVVSLGLSPVFTVTTDLIMSSVPPERAGTASGLSETSSELGGALGIALIGSAVTAIYRAALAADLPMGIPAALAARARDTLGGALAVAAELPASLGGATAEAARAAFAHAFSVAALLSAAITLSAAMLVALLLRRAPRTVAAHAREE